VGIDEDQTRHVDAQCGRNSCCQHRRCSGVALIVVRIWRTTSSNIIAVKRGLASAVSPFLSGWTLGLSSFGWPLLAAGGVKIVYDLLLLATFRKIRPSEEGD